MTDFAPSFVHVLLFQCPSCSNPVSAHKLAPHRSLEEADGSAFPLECNCGWSGEMVGLRARRHWVEPWRSEEEGR